jgi:hypothetical protein
VHQRSGGHDQQQGGSREDLRRLAARDPAQRRPQQQSAAEDDGHDHAQRTGGLEPAAARVFRRDGTGREQGHQREHRNRRDVLQQRDRQHTLAGRSRAEVALLQNGQPDRGRRHRQSERRHQRQAPRRAGQQADAEHQRG